MVISLKESDPVNLMATTKSSDPRSSDDLFEFFGTAAAMPEMCAADDVIICGELLPLWAPRPPRPKKLAHAHAPNLPQPYHRQSKLLGGPPPHPGPETRTEARRPSYLGYRPRGFSGGMITGEYREIKRVSDSLNPDPRGVRRQPTKSRPRWHVLLFRPVRIPAKMDIKEIRTRQQRLSTASLERKEAAEWGPWKLLQSLSCKGMEAVCIVT